MKKILNFGKTIVSVVLILCITAAAFQMPVYAAEKQRQSSFDYKKYPDNEQYRDALYWAMNDVYNTISDNIDDSKTLPIPGLIKTYSASKDKKKASKQFVPQGICRAGRFWLVTAYDAKKKCRSVIYAVDPLMKELVATVVLPNRFHAGGIAFDGENIWITGDTSDKYKGEPFLQYITFEDFRKMIDEPVHLIQKGEISKRVYIKNVPSFLEYDKGTLWVGTYVGRKKTAEAYMYGYKVLSDEAGVRLNTLLITIISGIDSSAQGADIDGNNLYVSSSYQGGNIAIKSSYITRYNITPLKDGIQSLSVAGREVSRVEVPKMNEEILVENGHVYINFESASEAWWTSVIKTDRILSVNKSLWN